MYEIVRIRVAKHRQSLASNRSLIVSCNMRNEFHFLADFVCKSRKESSIDYYKLRCCTVIYLLCNISAVSSYVHNNKILWKLYEGLTNTLCNFLIHFPIHDINEKNNLNKKLEFTIIFERFLFINYYRKILNI